METVSHDRSLIRGILYHSSPSLVPNVTLLVKLGLEEFPLLPLALPLSTMVTDLRCLRVILFTHSHDLMTTEIKNINTAANPIRTKLISHVDKPFPYFFVNKNPYASNKTFSKASTYPIRNRFKRVLFVSRLYRLAQSGGGPHSESIDVSDTSECVPLMERVKCLILFLPLLPLPALLESSSAAAIAAAVKGIAFTAVKGIAFAPSTALWFGVGADIESTSP
mmetsp:Transcript_2993/g.4130  ORF Transcript_2993/g.4130 Transcript_2993/m.4130 type:complete len:222 (+) Transcript_2993:147-812(+)